MRFRYFFLIFLLPTPVFAACSATGATVVYVNGIFNTEQQAYQDLENIKLEYLSRTNDSSIIFENGYNPSHLAGLGDLVQSAAQVLGTPVSTHDRDTILLQIHPQLTTRRLLLVGHSQGTLYTNEMLDYLLAHGEPKEAVGVYNIAAPTYELRDGSNYLNSFDDSLLNFVEDTFDIPLLPRNISIPRDEDGGEQWPGHSVSRSYLAGAPERVISDIQDLIFNLAPALASDAGECFTPPEQGLSYKTKQVFFAMADPTALGIKTATAAGYKAAVTALLQGIDVSQKTYDWLVGMFESGNQDAAVAAAPAPDFSEPEVPPPLQLGEVGLPQAGEVTEEVEGIEAGAAEVTEVGPPSVTASVEPESHTPLEAEPSVGPVVPIGPAPGFSPGGGGGNAPVIDTNAEASMATSASDSSTGTSMATSTSDAATSTATAATIDAAYVATRWPVTGFYCDGDTGILLAGAATVTYHPSSNVCNYLGGFSDPFWIFRVYVLRGVVGSSTVVAEVGSNGAGKIYTDNTYNFSTASAGDVYTVVFTEYNTNIGGQYNAHLLPDMHSYLTTGFGANGLAQQPDLALYTIPFTYAP